MLEDPKIPLADEKLIESMLKSRHREELIEIFDAAIDKWLEKKFMQFGKWTLGGLAASGLAWWAHTYITSGAMK